MPGPDDALPEDETPPDPWAPVGDATSPDLPPPPREHEAPEAPWLPVQDGAGPDLPPPPPQPGDEDETWTDTPPVWPRLADAPPLRAQLPILPPPRSQPLDGPRRVPFRTDATIVEPPTGHANCVADTAEDGSRLLVSSWRWVGQTAGGRVSFRLRDDGESWEVEALDPREPRILLRIRAHGVTWDIVVRVVVDREERGLRLGRDALRGRFIVDPAHED